jgi:hypothetical protein
VSDPPMMSCDPFMMVMSAECRGKVDRARQPEEIAIIEVRPHVEPGIIRRFGREGHPRVDVNKLLADLAD